jgi:hypothetical protein
MRGRYFQYHTHNCKVEETKRDRPSTSRVLPHIEYTEEARLLKGGDWGEGRAATRTQGPGRQLMRLRAGLEQIPPQ